MTVLLDTHTFYWVVRTGTDVPAHVVEALTSAPRRFVSDVSAFEVALKVRLGKWPEAAALGARWRDALAGLPALPLPLSTDHALLAGSLDWDHRDPFDRLLAAQAITEDLTVITADLAFEAAPGMKVVRW